MDIKISTDKSIRNVDELFDYLLRIEGLVMFMHGAEELNEIEAKETIKRFIDHYISCIGELPSFRFSISNVHYRNKSEEDIKIFETLKGYILEDKVDFCYKIVDALTIEQAREILKRFVYEYSGVKRKYKNLL